MVVSICFSGEGKCLFRSVDPTIGSDYWIRRSDSTIGPDDWIQQSPSIICCCCEWAAVGRNTQWIVKGH